MIRRCVLLFPFIAATVVAPGAVQAATCILCSASTEHSSTTGRSTTILASDQKSGPGAQSAAAISVIGMSGASAEVGALHARLDLERAAPGAGGTTMRIGASFSDTLTFDFGDNAVHPVTLSMLTDGLVKGAQSEIKLLETRFTLTGDFSFRNPLAFNYNIYNIRDNVTTYGGQGGEFNGQDRAFALASFFYTGDKVIDAAFSDTINIRSGATYTIKYELSETASWNGTPLDLDLTHTVRAGPISGDGLRSVTSGSSGRLGASGTGFGYDAPVSAVPEPASWAMLITGFGVIGGSARIRSRRSLLRLGM